MMRDGLPCDGKYIKGDIDYKMKRSTSLSVADFKYAGMFSLATSKIQGKNIASRKKSKS